jgi:uncharacterized HAD superfamily protein
MSRVGIDLDGVCYDFNRALKKYLTENLGMDGEAFTPSRRWEFYLDWGLSLEEFLEHCKNGVDAGVIFREGPVINDAVAQLWRLRTAGHTVHLITDRSFGILSEENTFDWLFRHGMPFDSVDFTADKTSIPVDYMIDDKPANYTALKNAGVDVLLMDAPWNQGFNARRTLALEHFVDYVIQKESEKMSNGHVSSLPKPAVVGEVRSVSSTGGEKGTKLARFDLIPAEPMWKLAELYGQGAKKYSDRNWERGYEWSKSYAAMQRHLNLFWQGIDNDEHEESCAADCVTHTGLPHLVCAQWHCMALLEFGRTHPEFDDRVKTRP